MLIEAITPIWYMVVAMVGQIIPVTYWWSCVAYSGLLKVAKSVTGSFFSRLGRFNRGSKSERAWMWSSTSWVQSCRSYLVVLMVVENVLRADQTPPSYQCRTVVVLRSYRQSWADKDRELWPRSNGLSRSWQIGTVCYDREHRQRMIGTVWPGRLTVSCNDLANVMHNIVIKIWPPINGWNRPPILNGI